MLKILLEELRDFSKKGMVVRDRGNDVESVFIRRIPIPNCTINGN